MNMFDKDNELSMLIVKQLVKKVNGIIIFGCM